MRPLDPHHVRCPRFGARAVPFGLVIRTTHVTGIVTDIGVIIGYWLRRRRVRPWKALLLVCILAGFFVGGLLGALAARAAGVYALGLAAAGCTLAGGGLLIWRLTARGREAV